MSTRLLRFSVLALQRQAARELSARLADLNLTPSQAEVISVVGTYGPLSVREVGELLVCESGSPSRLVQTLVNRGLVARAVSSEDRRASFLTLTPQGRDVLTKVQQAESAYESDLTQRLGSVDVDTLAEQLYAAVSDTALSSALDRRFRDGSGLHAQTPA